MTTTKTQLPDVRSLRIEGVATALTPISHGDGVAGTVALFRREKIAQLDGTITDVPVVSGNSLRGLLRDHAAQVMWRHLGSPQLEPAVFDLMWSGGQLTKSGSLSSRQLAQIRRVNPLVSLFGGSGAGRIIEGKLRVSRLVPICAETAHLLPEGITPPDQVQPGRNLLQIMEFSRRDDAKRDQLRPAFAGELDPGATADPATGELIPAETGDEPEGRESPMQMRYGVEVLVAGTQMSWGVQLVGVTDPEIALFAEAMDSWFSDGAHIGGRAATGHGRLRLDCHQWENRSESTTVGDALVTRTQVSLAAHVAAHRDEILETLGWFA